MNDKTVDFLQKLADKLGTTVDKIWSILIAQTKIDAITDALYILACIVSGILLWRLHNKFQRKISEYSNSYDDDDAKSIIMIMMAVCWIICALVCIFSALPNLINNLFNPQFQALKYIFDHIPS